MNHRPFEYNFSYYIQKITTSTQYPIMDQNKPKKTRKTSLRKKKIKTDDYGILIVEDESLWSQLYQNNLFQSEENQGKTYHYYEAHDGKEALRIIAQHYDKIDVIIIDLAMDKMEGMELLKFIVDKWGLVDLGIFMITAYGSSQDLEEAQLRGIKGFIDKFQLDFQKLSQMIETYLNLTHRNKAIDNGFYIEKRVQPIKSSEKGQEYIYLRWRNDDQTPETLYLGKGEEVTSISLPNLRTDLDRDKLDEQKKTKP